MTSWIDQTLFWHLYPLGFVGAESQAGPDTGIRHRLTHIVGWLDYAAELGATGLLLAPVFASSTHGYDTIDHFRIDPRLGDDADFDHLVAEAGKRGLRIVLDGVFNHVGREFPRFRSALAHGPGSDDGRWFRWLDRRDPSGEPAYETFEGHHALPALNHAEPAVAEYITAVMNHWLDRGVAGWRLDAAYAVPPDFWARVLPAVRQRHPEAYVFGEVIHGDYNGFVDAAGVDAVTQYELWKAIWSSINDRNLFELAWALERHNGFLDRFVPQTFVGNHDVTRLASRLDDVRHLPHALAILLTVGGTPSIYAGDEQAFRGIKEDRAGGDDAVRPAFPAAPSELSPDGWPVYRMHQQLIGMRRAHPWLSRARSRKLHLENRRMVMAIESDQRQVLLALNLDDVDVALPVPGATSVLAGEASLEFAATPTARLAAHGWAVLSTGPA